MDCWAGRRAANVGYPVAPLGDAIAQPAHAYLEKLGVAVVTGRAVRRVNTDANRVVGSVTTDDGRDWRADAYVSAVPFWTLPNLLAGAMAESDTVRRVSQLRASPIVNVHLRYDRPVMAGDFCYFLDSPLQWVFNSTRIFGDVNPDSRRRDSRSRDGRQSLSVSVSAAWDYIDQERTELARLITGAVSDAFPASQDATLLEAVVVKQRNATFRCIPGANRRRPRAAHRVPQSVPGRRMDEYRMAVHYGERGNQWL